MIAPDVEQVLALAEVEEDVAAFLVSQENAQTSAERSDNHKAKAIAMIKGADALNLTKEPNKALTQANEALDMCEDLKFDAGRGAAQALMARICAAHGGGEDDAEMAFDCAQDAVRLFKKLALKRGEAVGQYSTAKVEIAFGRPEQALLAAKEAMGLFRECGDAASEALACRVLADSYLAVGETRQATSAIKRALAIQVSLGSKPKEAACLQDLANIEVLGGSPEKAGAAFENAKAAFRAIKDYKGEAEVMNAERTMYLEEGSFAEAVRIAKETVTLFHNAMDRAAEGKALLKLAEMLLANNDLQRAGKVAEVALGVLSEAQDGEGMKQGMEMMGAVKHASVKMEMQEVIAMNKDFMHVPKSLVVDPGLNKRIQAAYSEATKQGLF